MGDHPNFRCTPFDGGVENTEFEFSSLYLHHIVYGPSPTQSSIISSDAATGWGKTEVNNWTIFYGLGPDAKVVAHAQGLHIYAGSWHNTFTIVFEIERLKESTLQVMGASVEQEGQWSIVGGTGELAMARGVISKKKLQKDKTVGGDIIELTIHGFCRKQMAVTITKLGPWGGDDGYSVDSERASRKIKRITIRHCEQIRSIEYSYIDQNGNSRTAGPWGDQTTKEDPDEYFYRTDVEEIVLRIDESLTEVSGTFTADVGLCTMKFVTSKLKYGSHSEIGTKTYGPYGEDEPDSTPFSAVAPGGKSIVGFFGSADYSYVSSIGVYIA